MAGDRYTLCAMRYYRTQTFLNALALFKVGILNYVSYGLSTSHTVVFYVNLRIRERLSCTGLLVSTYWMVCQLG